MQSGDDSPGLRAGPLKVVVGEIHGHVIPPVHLLIAGLYAKLSHKISVGDFVGV